MNISRIFSNCRGLVACGCKWDLKILIETLTDI
jgi:hypothetical protein